MSLKKKISIVPFSHLDLFWGGTREECLSRGGKVISTALELLEKYPEYRFMIESTNFIETYLDCFPEDAGRMKRLIKEGRLEIIPMRAIIYSHLPSGETTVRNLIYGREFCRKELDADPLIMSMSDIPGVTPQLPQIAKLAGMTEILLSRGFHEHTDHVWWTAPDGTGMRAYCPWHYASLCSRLSKEDYDAMISRESDFEQYAGAVDYPQIMHWGTDLYILTETILKNILRWNRSGRREFCFSTFREFFDRTKEVVPKSLKGGVPSSWPHIESSWPDLWPLDVPAEHAMFNAEFFGSLNRLAGYRDDYPAEKMKRAWLNLLDSMDHNQNGVGGETADADKLNLKRSAVHAARNCTDQYAWRLSARVTVPHESAAPVVVFNPLSWRRSGIVTLRAAPYGRTFATCFNGSEISSEYYRKNAYHPFRLIDSDGREIPYKKENHLNMLTDTVEFSFFAEDVPAFGCKAYYVEMLEKGTSFPSPFTIADDRAEDRVHAGRYLGADRVENRFFRLEIHRLTGELSLFDKIHGRMLFEHAAIIGLEERRGEYIYKMELSGRVMPSLIDSIDVVENNAVYCMIEIRGSVYGEPFVQKIRIAAAEPVIDIENTVDWRKIRYVRIEQTFPFASKEDAVIRYGVPFGMVRYPETVYQPDGAVCEEEKQSPTWNIRLARDWVDASDSSGGVTVASDHRMWTFDGNTMRNCMIRGIGWTSGGVRIEDDGSETGIQRPPVGKYTFRFRIAPHGAEEPPVYKAGWELNRPMHSAAAANAKVSAVPGLSLPEMPDSGDSSVIISNVKPSEDGAGVVFRCFECMGRNAVLALPEYGNRVWLETDLLEENGKSVSAPRIEFRPFEIKTLVLR